MRQVVSEYTLGVQGTSRSRRSENVAMLLHKICCTHQRDNERSVVALPLSPLEFATPKPQAGGEGDEANADDAEGDKAGGIVRRSIGLFIVDL